MFLIYLIGCVALQAWAWRGLIGQVRAGSLTRVQSTLRYVALAFVPLLLFVTGFAALVGVEEWFKVAVIPERAPLLVLPVLAVSVVGSLAFAIRSALVTNRRG